MLKQSGSSVYTVCGISKIGHSDIRKALYAPAMNFAFGTWKNGVYQPFVERLLANGKVVKVQNNKRRRAADSMNNIARRANELVF